MFTREIFYFSLAAVSILLLTMLVTRWGDRHSTAKSFILSLCVHLCLGFGWASVVESLPVDGETNEAESASYPVQLIEWDDASVEKHDNSKVWNPGVSAPAVTSSRMIRSGDVPAAEAAPERTPTEVASLTPAEAAQFQPLEEAQPDVQRQELQAMKSAVETAVAEFSADPQMAAPSARREVAPSQRSRRTMTRSTTPGDFGDSSFPPPVRSGVAASTAVAPQADLTPPMLASAVPPSQGDVTPRLSRNADFPTVREANRVAPLGTPNATPRGLVRGLVLDADTDAPLSSAQVRIDQVEGEAMIAVTDERGIYQLRTGSLPDHFAVSASRRGYLPVSQNLKRADVDGQARRLDFKLHRQNELVIAIEQDPKVHHLGNDRFEGNANSQFQHSAEGTGLNFRFEVTAEQLEIRPRRATLSLMTKGVQCAPRIWLNGKSLTTSLPESPADGSFGPAHLPIDVRWLTPGMNLLQIAASDCYGDLDDFEFVNLQIRLYVE